MPMMLKGHPAMVKVSDERSIGPLAVCTLVFEEMAVTIPPCGHIMMLDAVRKPAIYITSNALSFTLTPLSLILMLLAPR